MVQRVDQISTLVDYIKQEFAGHGVWDRYDPDRHAHEVSVATDKGVLLLTASLELFKDNSPAEVRRLLQQWNVADALRETDPAKRLLVTQSGCQVTSR